MKFSPSILAMAIAIGLSPLPVLANGEGVTDGARELDTVEVKGQRAKQQSTNQNVAVVGAKELEDEQAQTLEDAVRYIPGVTVTDLGRFGDNGFNIRGLEGDRVAITVDGLSLAEGVQTAVNYEFFRAGRGGLDVDALKQIEVIKGADAITAGSGALGGAVVFTTKDPSDYLSEEGNDTFASVKGGYTSATNEAMGSFTVANRTGIVESMLVYTRRDGHEAESYYDDAVAQKGSTRQTPDPADSTSHNMLAKVEFVPNAAHRFGLVYERARAENDLLNYSRSDNGGYFLRAGLDTNERDRYGLRWLWQADNAAFDHLELQIDRQETVSRGRTRIDVASGTSGGTPCTVTTLCKREEDRNTDQVLDRIALDLDKTIETAGAVHRLAYGLAWENREVDYSAIDYRWNNAGQPVSIEIDPQQVPQTDVQRWNVYLRDSVRLLDDRLRLTVGVRYDNTKYSPKTGPLFVDNSGTVHDVSFGAATWQLGAEYFVAERHSLWAQAGRGFRAPSAADMYAPTSTTQAVVAGTGQTVTLWNSVSNPDLKSERSLNLEAGYRWQGERARFGVSVYRDRYTDFIETLSNILRNEDVVYCTNAACTTTTRGDYYSMPANIGEITIKGVEVDGRWLLGDQWSARVAASYTEGEKKNGSPLDSIQPANAVLGVNYRAVDGRWNLTANVTHSVGKSASDISNTRDDWGTSQSAFVERANAYTVVDLFGTWNITDKLRLTAGVYNLFDEEYYQWYRVRSLNQSTTALFGGVTGDGIHRYSEPGRNYRTTLTYRF